MKRSLVALAFAVWGGSAFASDQVSELNEWVFEPCMEVAAAFAVGDYDQESRDLGIGRKHIAALMLESRQHAIEEVSAKMKAGASWDDRKAVYPVLLKLCLAEFMK